MPYIFIGFIAFLLSLHPANAKELTVERIFSSPSLNGPSIKGLKISPDGERVTFLRGKESDYERLDLWEYHIGSKETRILFDSDKLHSGKEVLSDEEKARRERLRLTGSGIVSYQWSEDGSALLFPLAGDVYFYRLGDKESIKLIDTPEFETDVKLSPRGNFISFIREQNLYVFDIKLGQEHQLTSDGGGAIKNGMAEFVAQEEMSRLTGYWWSEDESKIAFTRVDESPVEEVSRTEIYAEEIKTITQRYPFAGKNNVHVQLGVIAMSNKSSVRWVDLGADKDIYLPRVKWTKNSELLSFQWQSRDQKELRLTFYDWGTDDTRVVIREKSDTWINLHKDLLFLDGGSGFIWSSERDGFKHLYLYKMDGELVGQLTKGEWALDRLEGISDSGKEVYFTGRKESPLEKHLYSVSLDSLNIEKLTERAGYHNISLADNGAAYVDKFSSTTQPPQVSLHDSKGTHIAWLLENTIDERHPLYPYQSEWVTPEFGSIKNQDNVMLYFQLFKPKGFDATKKYPALVYLYGGPHAQMVKNAWGRYLPQYMAQQGYVVFTLDNRGAAARGKAFEDTLYRAMGSTEVDDQIEGVKYLHTQPWVDKERIGVHGHSYGGYMTLMAMFKAPEYFSAGVSGAPVTEWGLYDTHYTERYMGSPINDGGVYERASVFPYAKNLAGPLLIYHGMADDNVLFKNSTKLYKLLQDKNLPFYSMDYPGKKHSIKGKKTQMHRLNMIRNFFDLHFGVKR
ncbi:S9 family peptidase [Arenicella sp. 4NH20-0111]|uniref:S9 family peptidase n=1 Tax=Arenicella sp. 4NH20-0111 TaxID=3127648 RepID=UPI00310A82D1